MLSSPPPSSKDVCFFSPSLPDFLGGVHCPLCPKPLSLYLSLSYSLIHGGQRARERARRNLSPGQGGPRGGLGYKRAEKQRGEGGDNKTEKGDASVYLCSHVLCSFPLAAVLGENDRRMSGWRERLFSLRPCHGKHIHALWDLFIPRCTVHTHTHVHIHTLCPFLVLPHTHTHTHTHTPCHEMEGRGVKGQALW